MAEPVSLFASAITIGISAAQLSLALFSVAQTLKNAPREIAEIAEEISWLSGTFQQLPDIIRPYQSLCKPALFGILRESLQRYNQLEAQLKLLVDTPQKLARLRWCMKKSQAKSLLKKVESIKSALTLQLQIFQLAREELVRSRTNETTHSKSLLGANRFRKVVESAVQANRQIVEGAQRCHFKNSAWQRRQLAAELDVWKEDYFDTAIWLYHLVFGLNSPDSSTKNAASTYHNLVADSTSTDSQDPFLYIEPYSISHSTHSDSYDKTMIVWNRETEPSSVVDRLLFTWTKLTADQIMQSSICGDNDAWSKSFVKMVADAKIEEDQEKAEYLTERKQQGGYESPNDEESAIAEEVPYQEYPTETHQTVQRHPTYYGEYSNPFIYTHNRSLGTADNNSFQSTIHEAGDLELGTRERRARKPNTTSSTGSQITYDQKERQELPHGKVRWETNELPAERSQEHATSSRKYWEHSTLENRPTSSKKSTYQAHIDDTEQYPMQSDSGIGYGNDSTRDQYHRSSTRNPGKSSRSTSHHKRDEKPNIHIHLNTTQPGKDSPDRGEDDSSSSKTPMAFAHDIARSQPYPAGVSPNSREDSILTAMKCLSDAQQEQYAWLERREARLIAEVEKKDAQAAREKDQGKIRKLESLLIQQKEEQQKAQAVWGAERAALEEKAARRAQEVKDVAEKQVTAASLAKEAAQNALEALKADVERRNKEEADAKAVEARKRVEEQYKALLQRYEEQIETLKNSKPAGTSHRQSDRPHPVRRTHMSNGSRSIEVAEYTTDHLEPLGGSHFAALNISQEELYKSIFNSKENTESWENSDLSNSFSGSATREQFPQRLDGSINSTTERSQQNRQMILFPSKTSRNSTRTCELRMSLAKHGVNVEFEDPNNETHNELARYDCSRGEIVRSTLFWEPPVLRSGSELLATMRRVGWRPSYIRASVTGQTHYFGDQPVHLYFFQPDYKPQLTPWVGHVLSERLIIHKGLVEESVIQDFGFPYHLSQQDAYILHGHVTHDDIEALIEQSFSVRETRFRKNQRHLQCAEVNPFERTETIANEAHESPLTPRTATSTAGSCVSSPDAEPMRAATSSVPLVSRVACHGCHVTGTMQGARPPLTRDKNPFRSSSVVSSWL